ncbi:40S ribosomal protein S27 [Hordeum vulgare]|nr:40S ribosomal protein S27 [Hordeum vulgare]
MAATTSLWWTCVLGLRRYDDVCSNVAAELGRYGFLLQCLSHGGILDLEFDDVSGVLPRSYSFNDNGLMFGSDDSQNISSKPHAESDSGTSLERTPSDPGTVSSHGMPKAATRSRRKLNSDEESADFVPDESAPQK